MCSIQGTSELKHGGDIVHYMACTGGKESFYAYGLPAAYPLGSGSSFMSLRTLVRS